MIEKIWWGWEEQVNPKLSPFYVPTPNKLFKSASLNLNGIFDTWRRFGPTLLLCDAVEVAVAAESGDVASPLSKSVCWKTKTF